ncbi:MFS transporter [Georgenia alba]|uniref:MFS transporter n=1 Tax=Georgenia alba TaxID=2233858 RepID=A0ABW2Q8R2_9MICO
MTTRNEPLWTRDFVLATVVNLCAASVFYLLMTTLARYAAETFSTGESMSGLTASMFIVGAILARAVGGNVLELVGRHRTLLLALVLFLLASLSYLPTTSLGLLLVERFVHGVAFGMTSTAAITIAQSTIPPLRRSEGTGYFTLSNTVATGVGPFLGLTLIDALGYSGLFWGAVVISAAGLVVALLLRVPELDLSPAERDRLKHFRARDLLAREVAPLAVFIGVVASAYSGVIAFLDSYANGAGLRAGAGAFFLVYAVVLFVARLFVGRIQDRRGDNVVIVPAIASLAVGLGVLGVATSDVMVVISAAFVGFGFGTILSSSQAAAVGLVPEERLGVAVSTFYLAVDIGTGVAPALLGVVAGASGYRVMYLLLAAVVLASAGLYYLVHGRRSFVSVTHRRPG